MVRKRAMTMATMLAGNKEGDGDCNGDNMGNDDGNKGALATKAMATATM
jgi:hypothetical protein